MWKMLLTTAASLHLERVPSAASRAHTCHELHDVCLYQRQYVLPDPPQRWRRLLRVVRVRGVHVGHTEQTLAAMVSASCCTTELSVRSAVSVREAVDVSEMSMETEAVCRFARAGLGLGLGLG